MKVLFFAPAGFDYLSNQITEGLWLHYKMNTGLVSEFICTDKTVHHGSMIDDMPVCEVEYARQQLDDADIILFASGGRLDNVEELKLVIANPKLARKTIFLDGHDSNAYLIDPAKIAMYLKRELRYAEANYLAWPNVASFTFGVYEFHMRHKPRLDYNERDIDISFLAFGGSSPMRAECCNMLDKLAKQTNLNIVAKSSDNSQPYTLPEYRDVMRRSKVMISIPGAGIDTLRFWEAMGFGAVLASVELKDILYIRNAPEPRMEALYFSSWKHMAELCVSVIRDQHWWHSIRSRADKLVLRHHTTMRRAEQMIELYNSIAHK